MPAPSSTPLCTPQSTFLAHPRKSQAGVCLLQGFQQRGPLSSLVEKVKTLVLPGGTVKEKGPESGQKAIKLGVGEEQSRGISEGSSNL